MTEAVEPRSGFEVVEGEASLDNAEAMEHPSNEDLAVSDEQPPQETGTGDRVEQPEPKASKKSKDEAPPAE